MVLADLASRRGPPPIRGRGGPPPDGGMARMFGPPRRGPVMAPIEHNDTIVAVVWVPPLTGLSRFAETVGMPLAFGVILLLVAGTAVAALVVFRPAQARLRALEDAANDSAKAISRHGPRRSAETKWRPWRDAFNRMATDLAARQAQLVEADRARRQLLADVSHELMTPLTAIRGYAETLALPQFMPTTKEGLRAVKVIQEEGERIERLVKDLLDLARFEAGGMSLEQDNVDVDELFERVSERHAQAAQDKGVDRSRSNRTTTTSGWWAIRCASNRRCRTWRPTPFVIPRLAALSASAPAREGGNVKLTVADNGVGIPPEHLPHVFDRFYKADQSRLLAGGSGLGLSIVKAIVERHGGSVAVRSRQGVETVFEITLPERSPAHALARVEPQQHREYALKQVGVIGEQLEQARAIDAQHVGFLSVGDVT